MLTLHQEIAMPTDQPQTWETSLLPVAQIKTVVPCYRFGYVTRFHGDVDGSSVVGVDDAVASISA